MVMLVAELNVLIRVGLLLCSCDALLSRAGPSEPLSLQPEP